MKLLRGTFIGLFCLVVGFLVVWPAMPTQAQGAAPAKGKPALYDFGAGYCVPCKEMAKDRGRTEASVWRPTGIAHGLCG